MKQLKKTKLLKLFVFGGDETAEDNKNIDRFLVGITLAKARGWLKLSH